MEKTALNSLKSTSRLSFLKERAIKTVFFCTASSAVVVVTFILLFLLQDGYPIFVDVGIIPILYGDTWAPATLEPLYGIFPLVAGTLVVTIGAIVFAIPLSIGCAIYVSELASPRVKSVLKPAIELLAGIPSVVYGFFGLIVLTDFIRVTFDVPTGETWLAASEDRSGKPGLTSRDIKSYTDEVGQHNQAKEPIHYGGDTCKEFDGRFEHGLYPWRCELSYVNSTADGKRDGKYDCPN